MMRLQSRVGAMLGLAIVGVLVTVPVRAEVRLPAVFGDHMVLQRDKPLPIWGWADPGASVAVTLDRASVQATADAQGRWRVDLPAMPAGGPFTLTVADGQSQKAFDDVMLGEVWLCSGQSNMDMRLQKIWDDAKIERELQRDGIRLFRVERAIAAAPADDLDGQWTRCEPAEAWKFSAVAYFMGAGLQRELGVTVGLIHTAYGGTPAEAWTSEKQLDAQPDLALITERWAERITRYEQQLESYEAAVTTGDTKATPPGEPPARYAPGGLFNAMVHPLIPYAVRGAVWYQGESNVWRAMEYRPLLATLINDWRERWGQQDMHFGVVQLPNYEVPPRVPPGAQSWAELREAQLAVSQTLDHVGLVVTIDIGDPTDVHPLEKQEVGRRLTQWALAVAYGKEVVHSGPIYRSHDIDGDKVILHFDHPGSGLAVRGDGKLKGFVIAGPDRVFRWANAEVVGDTIVVSEGKVLDPQSVRYAWADNPYWANLVNEEGLPASPFRTDDWEGVTQSSP